MPLSSLGGADVVNFLNQYLQAGGDANLIGGTIMVDGTVLSSEGRAKQVLIGTPASGPQADTWEDEGWKNLRCHISKHVASRPAFSIAIPIGHRLL